MSSETPLVTKGLTLVTFALLISVVAIAATAGYSGYQEYRALSNLVSSQNGSQLTASVNGTKFEISGFNVPNNMTYPLTFELLGHIWIENQSVANFTSGDQQIQPGQSKALSITAEFNFTSAASHPAVLRALLFNNTTMIINTTIEASINPLLGINLTATKPTEMSAILQGLQVQLDTSQAAISSDGSHVIVPLSLEWTNLTPVTLNGTLNATITKLPGSSTSGNYGSASGALNLISGLNKDTLDLSVPTSALNGGNNIPHGNYVIDFVLSAYGATANFSQVVSA